MLSRRTERREIGWWQTELCRKRSVHSCIGLLVDLKFQEFSERHKTFTPKAPTHFEILMNLVGQKILRRDTRFGAAIPVQEGMEEHGDFGVTDDSYTCCNILSKFLSSHIVPEVCQAVAEAPMDNIKVKKN
jgi:hypothetical protein